MFSSSGLQPIYSSSLRLGLLDLGYGVSSRDLTSAILHYLFFFFPNIVR